jgi:hypothetical protein
LTIDDAKLENAKRDAGSDAPAAQGYRAAVLADQPISYWRLGEKPGATVARDEMRAHDATYGAGVGLGAPGALLSDSDTAAHFDPSVPSAYITVPGDAFHFEGTVPYTIEAWIRPDAQLPACGYPMVIQDVASDGTGDGWSMFINPDRKIIFNRKRAGVTNGPTSTIALGAGYLHVVGAYTGTTLLLYINGQVVDQTDSATPLPPRAAHTQIAADTNHPCYAGDIDEVAIYGGALSADQVHRHYVSR